jgi:hypothetical protein
VPRFGRHPQSFVLRANGFFAAATSRCGFACSNNQTKCVRGAWKRRKPREPHNCPLQPTAAARAAADRASRYADWGLDERLAISRAAQARGR